MLQQTINNKMDMKVFKQISMAVMLALFATTAFAQTKTDAVKAYNAGYEAANNNNYDEAISSYTQALTIANQLGPEGEDIKERAETQIPIVYFKKAVAQYQQFQQDRTLSALENTIAAFEEVVQVGNEYNDERVTPRAEGNIPRLYYTKSVILFQNENYEEATKAVDQALNLNSNYATAYYHKGKIIKKQNDTNNDGIIDENIEDMLQWFDRAIQTADATGERETAETTREAAHDELLAVGVSESEAGNLQRSIELLNKAIEYDDESADAYYRLAEVHNKAGNPELAVENANTALDYENGGKTDKAKIYFELGFAHQTLGNKSVACDAFSNALFGSFKSPAEHKMEFELKCDSTAE